MHIVRPQPSANNLFSLDNFNPPLPLPRLEASAQEAEAAQTTLLDNLRPHLPFPTFQALLHLGLVPPGPRTSTAEVHALLRGHVLAQLVKAPSGFILGLAALADHEPVLHAMTAGTLALWWKDRNGSIRRRTLRRYERTAIPVAVERACTLPRPYRLCQLYVPLDDFVLRNGSRPGRGLPLVQVRGISLHPGRAGDELRHTDRGVLVEFPQATLAKGGQVTSVQWQFSATVARREGLLDRSDAF